MTARTQAILATAVTLALLVSYVALTALDHDADAILALLVGYLGGAAPPAIARKSSETSGRG